VRRFGLSIQGKLLLSHFAAVLMVSGSIGTFFYVQAGGSLLVGLDMRLGDVRSKCARLRIAGAASLAAAVVLAFFFSRFLAAGFTVPMKLLTACSAPWPTPCGAPCGPAT